MHSTYEVERITNTIEEVAELLGIGKTLAYELANRGELPVVRLGRRMVVPRRALDQWLANSLEVSSCA